ncbi:MAG TPA: NADH-quinone oxidoreductase subunit NuoI [Candidatus Manganitrophaceae bacterium]|nr:NADH-quinone oxidoreductase subunit NuoI [Candidatus Manganitrophaceae bacterium]
MRNAARWVKEVFFTEIAKGLGLTFKHMFVKPITGQYPHQKRSLPDGYRGVIVHLRYDDMTEKCVGCALCEAACPSHCITVISDEDPKTPQRRIAKTYILDVTKCVFCGFCVQACPVDALASSKEYEMATGNKRSLMMDKEAMLALGDKYFPQRPKRPKKEEEEFLFYNKMKQIGFPAAKQDKTAHVKGAA